MIYLDENYKAHTAQDAESTRTPWVDTNGIFIGKCNAFIEGYRVIPEGTAWTRADGEIFHGLMISPILNPFYLQTLQAEADQLTITALDTEVVDLTYQNILLEMGV